MRTSPIEYAAINTIPDSERQGTPREHFWVWAAANLNPSVITSTVAGLGLITSDDPYMRPITGYLLTSTAKQGTLGSANVGIVAAFVLAAIIYAILTTGRGGRSQRTSGPEIEYPSRLPRMYSIAIRICRSLVRFR